MVQSASRGRSVVDHRGARLCRRGEHLQTDRLVFETHTPKPDEGDAAVGPLEFFIIEMSHDSFASTVLPELADHLGSGSVRLVDLIVVDKNDEGTVEITEVGDLDDEASRLFEHIMADLSGLLTPEDVFDLCDPLPSGATAVVALFEHVWAGRLRDAIDAAGGVVALHGRPHEETLRVIAEELDAHLEEAAS